MSKRLFSMAAASIIVFASTGTGAASAASPAAVVQLGGTVTVTVPSLNVRSGPSYDAAIVGLLGEGTSVRVIATQGEWLKIDYQGYQTYVFAAYTTAGAATAPAAAAPAATGNSVTPTGDYVNVRSGPGLDQAIVGQLNNGESAAVIGSSGEWTKVNFKGYQAFVFTALTTGGGAPAATSAPAAAGNVVIPIVYSLNVRSGPGLDQDIIGSLSNSQSAAVLGTEGEWTKINYQGHQAFVFTALTRLASSGAPAAAAAAAPAAAIAPVTGAGAKGGFELGAHVKDLNSLGRLKSEAGADWIKYQVVMGGGGAPDLGGVIGAAHGAGLKVLIGAIGDRGRAPDTGYHSEYAAQVSSIARQGADAIEVWNEPNLDREWGGGGAGRVNPDTYVNLLKLSYNAIKSANGGTMVIAAASAPTGYAGGNCRGDVCDDNRFLERVYAAGGTNYMDCQGAHFNGSPHPPDMRDGGDPSGHYSWYFWGTFDTTWNSIHGARPICFTEMGYVTKDGIAGSLPGGFSWGNNISLGNQAEWEGRMVTLLRQSGRARLGIIWNWNFRQFDNDPQAGYSILRPDNSCPTCGSLRAAMGR